MAIIFKNDQHRQFYEEQVSRTHTERDPYHKAFFYTMELLEDTRRNVDKLYNFACNLFNGYTGSGKAARMYTHEELFCSGLINYMLEAVRIRYADYSNVEE